MEWPTVAEVHAYRGEVYRLVTSVIQTAPEAAISGIDMDSPYWALPMAMEHERIHIETSSVLIRELPLEYVARPATWPEPHVSGLGLGGGSGGGSGGSGGSSPPPGVAPAVENPLLPVEGGEVRLGKPRDFPRCERGDKCFLWWRWRWMGGFSLLLVAPGVWRGGGVGVT